MAQNNGPNPTGAPFELIDGYKCERYISKGSYGEVYAATRTVQPSPPAGFVCPNINIHPTAGSSAIGIYGSPTYLNPNPDITRGPNGNPQLRPSAFANVVPPPATVSAIPNRPRSNSRASSASGHSSDNASSINGGAASGDSNKPSSAQRANSNNPRLLTQGVSSPLMGGVGVGSSQQQQPKGPIQQRVAIKVVRDYARRGTSVQGSDRYVSRYTKKIAREVQLLQYFNGCKEFVPVYDMYLSVNKQDLYVVMKMFDFSLYTFVRREVALKKQQEEEDRQRSPKKVRVECTSAFNGQQQPQQNVPQQQQNVVVPAAPVRKGLRRIMTEKQTKLLTVQLLSGLAKMAAVGSAHRDLSSGNVLYEPKTHRIAICDFGLSRANISAEMAQTTNVVTAPYRSPELLLLINKYDGEKVDVWSVGILMMEMLIGCPPVFEQNDNLQREGVFRNLCYCDMDYWRRLGAPNNLLENDRGRKFDHYNKYPKFLDRLASEGVLGADGIAVLKSCLEQKPEDRRRCKELLNMPWFQRDEDAVKLIDELTAHADRDKAFQRRQLPNIEDGYGRDDHIRWLESVVPKIATRKQPCPVPAPK